MSASRFARCLKSAAYARRGDITLAFAAAACTASVASTVEHPAKKDDDATLRRHNSIHGQVTKRFLFYQNLGEGPGGGGNSESSSSGLGDGNHGGNSGVAGQSRISLGAADDDDGLDLTPVVFGGSIYPELAQDISSLLGLPVGQARLARFVDGECDIAIGQSLAGSDVFIVCPTNTNDALIELCIFISAAKRASASRVTAILPFYGYGRQDRRFRREPLAAADVALMFEAMGVDRVVAVDLHSAQTQGFFSLRVPVDHVMVGGLGAAYFAELLEEEGWEAAEHAGASERKIVVVATQEAQVARARHFQNDLLEYLRESDDDSLRDLPVGLAFVSRGTSIGSNSSSIEAEKDRYLVGAPEVKGAFCLLVDDLVDTGETLAKAVTLLNAAGAARVAAYATHGRFSGDGERIVRELPGLDFLVTCNTLPHRDPAGRLLDRSPHGKLRELSLAPLLAEVVYRLNREMPFPELLYGGAGEGPAGEGSGEARRRERADLGATALFGLGRRRETVDVQIRSPPARPFGKRAGGGVDNRS